MTFSLSIIPRAVDCPPWDCDFYTTGTAEDLKEECEREAQEYHFNSFSAYESAPGLWHVWRQ